MWIRNSRMFLAGLLALSVTGVASAGDGPTGGAVGAGAFCHGPSTTLAPPDDLPRFCLGALRRFAELFEPPELDPRAERST